MNTSENTRLDPPAELEERVVARLHAAGLLADANTRKEGTRMKTIHTRWAVAAVVLAAAGLWAGTQMPHAEEAAAPADTRPAFALMLYEDDAYQAPANEAEHSARVAEYSAWARELASTGNLVDGAELLARGVLLRANGTRNEMVPVAAEGVLAGYFVIRAASMAEAETIAADCPHLAYGGTVSLRPTGA